MANLNLQISEDMETGAARYTTAQSATAKVVEMGFRFPPPPQQSYNGYLPVNLTQLPTQQLGQLLNEISTYLSWAEGQLAEASAIKNDAEHKLEYIQSSVRIALKANAESRMSNPEKDDYVRRDARVQAAELSALEKYAIWDIVRALVKGAQKDWDTVSRHITLIGQEMERRQREGFVNNIPVRPQTYRR